MKESTAKQIMTTMKLIDLNMAKLAETIEEVDVIDERAKLRHAYAMLVGHQFTEIMLPVIRQFPHLDPDKNQDA